MMNKLPPKILVIEDDTVINTNLCNFIERSGFDILRAFSASQALKLIENDKPDILVISSRIKDASAKEAAAQIKAKLKLQNIATIFLIDKSENAANYIVGASPISTEILRRPFYFDQLLKYIKNILRKNKTVLSKKILAYGNIQMNLSTKRVFVNKQQINLGPTEFKILRLMLQKPNTIYSRKQIIQFAWGEDKEISPRTIDVHINRIRNLLTSNKTEQSPIRTIRSIGYSLV